MTVVGQGSHSITFSHQHAGSLTVKTGADRVAWGYELNAQVFPTYGGEVVQILSCFVSDLEISGTLQTYWDMEKLYGFFINYLQMATQGDNATAGAGSYNQEPMTMEYPHRGWTFKIIPLAIPGFRKGREVVAPEWRLMAHIVDEGDDVANLKDLIIQEAELKAAVNSNDPNFSENFGLQGKIKFVDENPFSDPFTDVGEDFTAAQKKAVEEVADYYSKLLPSYLDGDFDAIVGDIASKPTWDPNRKQGTTKTEGESGGFRDSAEEADETLKRSRRADNKARTRPTVINP
jgi:hypothetical protein